MMITGGNINDTTMMTAVLEDIRRTATKQLRMITVGLTNWSATTPESVLA